MLSDYPSQEELNNKNIPGSEGDKRRIISYSDDNNNKIRRSAFAYALCPFLCVYYVCIQSDIYLALDLSFVNVVSSSGDLSMNLNLFFSEKE